MKDKTRGENRKIKRSREDEEKRGEMKEKIGEPLVQMTTPHAALNCLFNCPPSGN